MKEFDIVISGTVACGKTSLFGRLSNQLPYSKQYAATMGGNFFSKQMTHDIRYTLCDMPGNTLYGYLNATHYRNAFIGIVCIDLSAPLQINIINKEISKFPYAHSIILVGTKADSPYENNLHLFNTSIIKHVNKKIMTSAKTTAGVDRLTEEIKQCILQSLSDTISKTTNQDILQSMNETVLLSSNQSPLIKALNIFKRNITALPIVQRKQAYYDLLPLMEIMTDENQSTEQKWLAIQTFHKSCQDNFGDKSSLSIITKRIWLIALCILILLTFSASVEFGIALAAFFWHSPSTIMTTILFLTALASTIITSSGLAATTIIGLNHYGIFKINDCQNAAKKVIIVAENQLKKEATHLSIDPL